MTSIAVERSDTLFLTVCINWCRQATKIFCKMEARGEVSEDTIPWRWRGTEPVLSTVSRDLLFGDPFIMHVYIKSSFGGVLCHDKGGL